MWFKANSLACEQNDSGDPETRKKYFYYKILEEIFPFEEKLKNYFVEVAFLIEYLETTNFLLMYISAMM
jgi:hypothetical protein